MTKEAVIKQVIELLESNDTEKENEAFELAYKFDIALTEIWDDEDEEIIGMMVEDTTLKDFGYIKHDTVIGTTGKGLHLEAIELIAEGLKGKKLQARVHIQDIGWTRWTSGMIGTIGMNKKIEAIEIRLV